MIIYMLICSKWNPNKVGIAVFENREVLSSTRPMRNQDASLIS